MPFTIDEDSLLIKGRKGDTAAFTFNFSQDISDYTIHFYVKKNMDSADVIIDKAYANPINSSVTVKLSTEDTEKLATVANAYSTYYWGLKICKGTNFAQTIIPQEFNNPPMMYVYPEIGGV